MPVLGLLVVVVLIVLIRKVGAAAIAEQLQAQQQFFGDWLAATRAAGLEPLPAKNAESRAQGLIDGVLVQARLQLLHSENQPLYRASLWAKDPTLPRSLTLRGDSSLRSMERWVTGRDVPIGDPEFDRLVELPVVDAYVCAALCYQARAQLTQLLGWGGYVKDGAVAISTGWSSEYNRWLSPLVNITASLVRLLSVPPEQLAQRLAYNALQDPARDVRLENLRYLVAPETRAPAALLSSTAESLLTDVHAPIRLLAAQHAGARGHAALRALAADDALEIALRVQAVESLGRPPEPDLEGLRDVVLDSQEPELVCSALSVLPANADAALIDAVLRHAQAEEATVRAAAARALGARARPDTEPALLGLLSDDSPDVQQASAEALGLFGSVAAVEPLLPLAESVLRPRLRQAARGAIGRIQSRLGNAEAGRLSLPDPDGLAGALDVADESAAVRIGALSLAHETVAAGPVRVADSVDAATREARGLPHEPSPPRARRRPE
jgi:HEAT repeat protein